MFVPPCEPLLRQWPPKGAVGPPGGASVTARITLWSRGSRPTLRARERRGRIARKWAVPGLGREALADGTPLAVGASPAKYAAADLAGQSRRDCCTQDRSGVPILPCGASDGITKEEDP